MNREKFQRDVLSLFKAGWDSKRIGDWAMTAASGFAREWDSPDHAYDTVADICRAYNRTVAADNRFLKAQIIAKLEADPIIREMVRTTKGKWKF